MAAVVSGVPSTVTVSVKVPPVALLDSFWDPAGLKTRPRLSLTPVLPVAFRARRRLLPDPEVPGSA